MDQRTPSSGELEDGHGPFPATFAMHLAVLPKYRSECFRLVKQHFCDSLEIFVSRAHLDRTVKSGVPESWVHHIPMVRFGRLAFLQVGGYVRVLSASVVVLDLNPRSMSSWFFLGVRRLLRRPTLVWGHIHPKAGAESNTAQLRLWMRRLASATISYTYSDQERARDDLPGQTVYVAPNAVYLQRDIEPAVAISNPHQQRHRILYVGRLEPEKKPELLIEALSLLEGALEDHTLTLVGSGSQVDKLKQEAERLGVSERVEFTGWVDDLERLRTLYSEAYCSVSPGFAGLGLTQSLGFGVPMVVSRDERHSPEIELATLGGVTFFESDNATSLADELHASWQRRNEVPLHAVSQAVRESYSAEAMSAGLIAAMEQEVIAR